jgi:hypothetical protein
MFKDTYSRSFLTRRAVQRRQHTGQEVHKRATYYGPTTYRGEIKNGALTVQYFYQRPELWNTYVVISR